MGADLLLRPRVRVGDGDYTVFLSAPITETYDRTRDVREAVVEGLAGTGRVNQRGRRGHGRRVHDIRDRGAAPTRRGGAVDATLVRLLLQPVILRLLGRRAWWMPAWLDQRLPEVRVSHELPEAKATPPLSAASLR
jgi:putative drug exporter of the RND superfamily